MRVSFYRPVAKTLLHLPCCCAGLICLSTRVSYQPIHRALWICMGGLLFTQPNESAWHVCHLSVLFLKKKTPGTKVNCVCGGGGTLHATIVKPVMDWGVHALGRAPDSIFLICVQISGNFCRIMGWRHSWKPWTRLCKFLTFESDARWFHTIISCLLQISRIQSIPWSYIKPGK